MRRWPGTGVHGAHLWRATTRTARVRAGSGKTVAFLAPVLLQLRALRARARAAAQEAERARAAVQEGAAAGSSSSSKKGRKAGGAAVAAALAAAEEAEGLAQELWPAAIKAVVLSPSHELTAQQVRPAALRLAGRRAHRPATERQPSPLLSLPTCCAARACAQARVLKHLLPGSNLCASTLTKSTAAGSDFSKVRGGGGVGGRARSGQAAERVRPCACSRCRACPLEAGSHAHRARRWTSCWPTRCAWPRWRRAASWTCHRQGAPARPHGQA